MWRFFFRFIVLHKLKVVNSERKKKATKIETKKQEQQQQMHPTIAIALPMAKYMTFNKSTSIILAETEK